MTDSLIVGTTNCAFDAVTVGAAGPSWPSRRTTPLLVLDFLTGEYTALGSPRAALGSVPGWSYSRAGGATMADADGTIVPFLTGVPRRLDGRGLLIEAGAAKNLVPHSADHSQWDMYAGLGSVTALTGSALGLSRAAVASAGATWHRTEAGFDVVSGETYYVTLVYEAGTSGAMLVGARDLDGARNAYLSGDIGALVPGGLAGVFALQSDEVFDGDVRVLHATYVPDFTGPCSFGVGPNSAVSGETVIVGGVQVETGARSSFIVTGAAVTEVSSLNLLSNGGDHSQWGMYAGLGSVLALSGTVLEVLSRAEVVTTGATWQRTEQIVNVTAGTTYYLTIYYEAGTSGQMIVTARDVDGAANSTLSGAVGSLVQGGTAAGPITLETDTVFDGDVRVLHATFVSNFTGPCSFGIGPNSSTNGQTVIVDGVMFEAGARTPLAVDRIEGQDRAADVATITVTDLDLAEDHRFEVTVGGEVERVEAESGALTLPDGVIERLVAMAPRRPRPVIHIVLKGQSNRPGTQAFPILTDVARLNGARSYVNGLHTWKADNFPLDPELRPAEDFEIIPFVDIEDETKGVPTGQTMCNGFATMWQELELGENALYPDEDGALLLFTWSDLGGTKRTEMNEDDDRANPLNADYVEGETGGHFETTFDDASRAKEIFTAMGHRYMVGPVAWEQGNADNDRTGVRRSPAATKMDPDVFYTYYADMIERDRVTHDTRLRAISGQNMPVPMTEWAMDAPYVVEAFLQACEENPLHTLLGPTYQFAGANKSPQATGDKWGAKDHETPDDQILKGEWEALHYWNWLRNGVSYSHLYPYRGVLNQARDRFSLYFKGDDLPVAVDVTTFGEIEGYGIQLFELGAGGALANASLPTSYEIMASDRIDFLFDAPVPTGKSHWNYAVHPKMGDLTEVVSVRDGPAADNGEATTEILVTGDVSAQIDPVMTTEGIMMILPEGVFAGNMRNDALAGGTPGGAPCYHTYLTGGGNTVLRIENPVLETALGTNAAGLAAAVATHFPVGSLPQFGRGRGCGNLCAATARRQSIHTFSSLYAGTTREGETWAHKSWAVPRTDQLIETGE